MNNNETTIDPFENPIGRNPGPEYWQWYTIYEQLQDVIYQSLPFEHPVRWAFMRCEPELDIHPNLEALKQTIRMVAGLTPDERRMALGGWVMPKHFLEPGEPVKDPTKVALHFDCHNEPNHSICAGIERFSTDSSGPVEVFIYVGTPKMDAVKSLRRAADQLEREWEKIVTETGQYAEENYERTARRAAARESMNPPETAHVKETCPTCGAIAVDSSFDEERGLTMRCTTCGREWLPGGQFCTSTDAQRDAAGQPAKADAGDWVDAAIDDFYKSTSALLKSLGISTSEDDDGITMFDGSKRRVFYADGERGIAGGFLGPKFDTVKGDESNED